MNKLIKLALLAVLAVATATQVKAAQTNLVQTITMAITVYGEDDSITNGTLVTRQVIKLKAATKDIIGLLGDALLMSFSPKAKLLLISPVPSGSTIIVVQDGTNRVDVTGFFEGEDGDGVSSLQLDTATGIMKSTQYRMFRLRLRDDGSTEVGVHFDVSGFATIKTASVVQGSVVLDESDSMIATLAGTGEVVDGMDTVPLMVQVMLKTSPAKLEVLP